MNLARYLATSTMFLSISQCIYQSRNVFANLAIFLRGAQSFYEPHKTGGNTTAKKRVSILDFGMQISDLGFQILNLESFRSK